MKLEVGVWVDGRQGQKEARPAAAHVGNRAADLGIDRLVPQPVAESFDHPCRLGDMSSGGHVEIDQKLIAVTGWKEFLNDKLKGKTGQGHETRDQPQHHDPKSQRILKKATVEAVKTVVIGVGVRFLARPHFHKSEAHERRHVHGEEP